jgi:predicted metal-dependent hydrolase
MLREMSSVPPEPVLTAEERLLFEKGVQEFNSGYFFECHDTLEDLWSGLRGPVRDFFQGLIQVSVGFYHLGGGNLGGAESMLLRALKRLEPYPSRYFGFDLDGHRVEIRDWLERIRAGDVGSLTLEDLPKWNFA